jgi:hypothetical protein
MKAITFIITGTLCAGIAQAQKLKEADVPAAVKESFKKEFPNAKAKEWEKEKTNYEVEFDLNKTETSATFNASGKLMETEQEIAVSALPKAVAEYVTKNHADYKISEASKITEAGTGKVSYEAEIKKGKEEWDLIFDDKGNFLKKENETKTGDKD